jgi:hypothetical protein
MRVRVDRQTLAPLGIPEYLGGDKMMDDFSVDEDAGVAYVTTHRENTIDRMSLEPDRNEETESVAGKPFDEELVDLRRDGRSLRSSALVREALQERPESRSPNSRMRECHVTVGGRARSNYHLDVVRCGR